MAIDLSGEPLPYDPFLQVGLPPFILDDLKKQPRSRAMTQTEFKIMTSDERMTLPVLASTKVIEIMHMLAVRLGVDSQDMQFIVKQGTSYRKQYPMEEIGRKVVVKGIPSFSRQKKAWEHPIAIIGCGHMGLRLAMWYLKHGFTNFVEYDRKHTVGGTSWHDQANTQSKLQTELGTYHLQYDEDNPVPTNLPPWPSRDQLLQHFLEVSEEYGIIPYCKFNTEVKAIAVEKGDKALKPASQWYVDQTYRFSLETGKDDQPKIETEVVHSCVSYFPGNLTVPREETYRGEDVFGGYIDVAMHNNVDYAKRVTGKKIALVGHGAFAVENVRTCCEFGVKHITMVARRRNLCCPRICSWLINQSVNYLSGPLYMKSTEPAYKLTPYDPWTYHSVHSNEKRTHLTITQKARFGIGDVYFLAIGIGLLEVVEDKIKRLTAGTIHLESGNKLEVSVILKLLGFNGNWDFDRLMGVKEMLGYWCNGDFRRVILAEPIGVNANNFGGTSFSPGARNWAEQFAYFQWYPKDFAGMFESGMLPKHKAEPENDRPAYVIDARHGTTTAMVVDGSCLGMMEGSGRRTNKSAKQRECHPTEIFLQQCKDEWDEYGRKWFENGAPGPIPPYPYTLELVQGYLAEEQEELQKMMARMGG